MANTYVQQRIHLVWSTKHRQEFLSARVRAGLWPFLGSVVKRHHGVLFEIGGVDDHLHLYAEYPKTVSLAQFVNTLKSVSSKWLKETYPELQGFRWQSGYGGFSVSRKGDERLQEYIRNQEFHHRRVTFQEEYLRLLRHLNIEYDPRYVFD
jgi:REP element-mobilizing transposase RayT